MAESRDWVTPVAVVAGLGILGVGAYVLFHKTTPVDLTNIQKQTVVYNNNNSEVAAGQKVAAAITVKNTGNISASISFRCDLLKTGIASPNEGSWTKFTIPAGGTQTLTVNSISIPSDWGVGQGLHASVLLEGVEGDWDTSGLLTVSALGNADISFTNSYPVTVEIDWGEWSGTTPFTMNFLAGVHNWVASDNAGNSNSGTFTVVAGTPQTINVNVKTGGTQTGTLHITWHDTSGGSVPGAVVKVDGTQVTNGQNLTLQAGYHTWAATASGYYADSSQVLIEPGQTLDYDILLLPVSSGGGGGGGGVTPTVTMSAASYIYGSQAAYSFKGFQPNAQIYATIQGQASAIDYPESDANGNGSSYFLAYLDNGSYTLVVTDNYGHSATASFSVSGQPVGGLYSFILQVANAAAAFPGATHWWAYYMDPVTGKGVSDQQWHLISQSINFSNVNNYGWLAVFLYNSSTGQTSTQISSAPLNLVASGLNLVIDASTGGVTGGP